MPTLTECTEQIGELVQEKGFQSDLLFFKLVWGFVEVAEAIDKVKKGGLPPIPDDPELPLALDMYINEIGTEIVDVVFYMCDAYRLLKRRYPWIPNMDDMFNIKMSKNMDRPKRYGQGWIDDFMKSTIDHMNDEGKLDEFILDIVGYANGKKRKTLEDMGFSQSD